MGHLGRRLLYFLGFGALQVYTIYIIMKELVAAFSAEIFRPIVTLLIPGFWAISPALIAIFFRYPTIWAFAEIHSTATSIIFLVAATAVGMILENFGGELENYHFSSRGEDALIFWYRYLSISIDSKPPAFSYIRSYVLRLKFEAGMCVGGIPAFFGIWFLPTGCLAKIMMLVITMGLTGYFAVQVKSSVKELDNVRRSLFTYFPFAEGQEPLSPIRVR